MRSPSSGGGTYAEKMLQADKRPPTAAIGPKRRNDVSTWIRRVALVAVRRMSSAFPTNHSQQLGRARPNPARCLCVIDQGLQQGSRLDDVTGSMHHKSLHFTG